MNNLLSAEPNSTEPSPLRSIHTNSFPALLNQLGISLAVSTYQAGKVVLLRAEGDQLNTHFRLFDKPMGMALAQPNDSAARLALGIRAQIIDLRNTPATAAKLTPQGQHDACFLPRNSHTTGDIDIHEMAWGKDGLWFINTRFSCLCTCDADHSFIPRWRPPFVSAYAPEDRCHLNGLALVDGEPKYITALGTGNSPGGWRPRKADGGILMDITDNRMICQGLSMPHSPRWYRDQLWVLESGCGSLAKVDQATGELTTVAELPGFTRGISFCGPLAFIGLSKVRESAVFSGIPITKRVQERFCGVWVVNIETGETVAFLKFEEAVQEIFAVEVLQGIRYPEIINDNGEHLQQSYILPDEALKEVAFTPISQDNPAEAIQKGDAAYHQGKFKEATQYYQQALAIDPSSITARYNLGVVLIDQQQWPAGIEQLEQVVAEDRQHAEAHNALGTAKVKLGQLQAAQAHFEVAVASDPTFKIAAGNLAALQQAIQSTP